MTDLWFHLKVTFGILVGYTLFVALNAYLAGHGRFSGGVVLVYLPAGLRLLLTLVFGWTAFAGLLLSSVAAIYFFHFPFELERALVGGVLTVVAPYIAYLSAQRLFGIEPSLRSLDARKLLFCVLLYALVNALLLGLWVDHVMGLGQPASIVRKVFVADLLGAIVIIYALKIVLALRRNAASP